MTVESALKHLGCSEVTHRRDYCPLRNGIRLHLEMNEEGLNRLLTDFTCKPGVYMTVLDDVASDGVYIIYPKIKNPPSNFAIAQHLDAWDGGKASWRGLRSPCEIVVGFMGMIPDSQSEKE